jgi:hypothetical protein
MQKSALLLSTAIGLTVAVAGTAGAMPKATPHNGALKKRDLQHKTGAPGRPARPERMPSSGPSPIKEKFTLDTWASTTASLLGGFSLDASTQVNFTCKKKCTVLTNAVVAFSAYYSYNNIGYCPMVDGYFTSGSCFFVNLPSGSGWNNIPFLNHASVAAGTHSAEVYLYTVAPAYIGPRQTDYHVYY